MNDTGAEQDFLHLYERFADAVFRHCLFRVSDRQAAEDLTQETFMRCWQYISSGQTLEYPKAFLFRIATNLIIDRSRKKKDSSLDEMEEAGFDLPDTRLMRPAEATELQLALEQIKRLPEDLRQAVILRHVEGFSPPEIAEILGISENLVSVRIHRGLKQLLEFLEHDTTPRQNL